MKTILAIGYYDDFARFFLAIKNQMMLKSNKNFNFQYLSIYLSGFLYYLLRCRQVDFISLRVFVISLIKRKKFKTIISKKKRAYRNIELEQHVKYHELISNQKKEKLILQTLSYVDYYYALLEKKHPDLIILSGDSRMSISILREIALIRNIKIIHFEQGPFGTTILDPVGVNANVSFRRVNIPKTVDKNTAECKIPTKRKKYTRNSLYRISDYVFSNLLKPLNLLPFDLYESSLKKNISSNEYSKIKKKWDFKQKNILLILQVPSDVNMILHSPIYNNYLDMIKDLNNNLPIRTQLIVREHPLYKGKYGKDLYNYMLLNNIILDQYNLIDSMNRADIIVVNNSTVGIEAIAMGKKVIVLGNAYYDNEKLCVKLSDRKSIKEVISKALSFKVNDNHVQNYLNFILTNHLIQGHFRDNELNVKTFSNVISSYINSN